MRKEANIRTVGDSIIELANESSPTIGKRILEQYEQIPFVVRDAVDGFYEVMEQIDDRDSIGAIKESLKRLEDACEANPGYKDVYEAAKREAQETIAEVIANEGMSLFEEE